jgi:hypothetical protein
MKCCFSVYIWLFNRVLSGFYVLFRGCWFHNIEKERVDGFKMTKKTA